VAQQQVLSCFKNTAISEENKSNLSDKIQRMKRHYQSHFLLYLKKKLYKLFTKWLRMCLPPLSRLSLHFSLSQVHMLVLSKQRSDHHLHNTPVVLSSFFFLLHGPFLVLFVVSSILCPWKRRVAKSSSEIPNNIFHKNLDFRDPCKGLVKTNANMLQQWG
jgi:hypothetical protein